MENLLIEATKYTPKINFDMDSARLEIRGKSYPENTFEFYEPILTWIKHFLDNNSDKTVTFDLEIIYYNSSSSKALFDLFDIVEEAVEEGSNILINWYYDEDNETALEAGEDFIEDFENLNFNLIELRD